MIRSACMSKPVNNSISTKSNLKANNRAKGIPNFYFVGGRIVSDVAGAENAMPHTVKTTSKNSRLMYIDLAIKNKCLHLYTWQINCKQPTLALKKT